MTTAPTTFHDGEIEAQRHAGTEDVAASIGSFIRDQMPDQHRAFFAALPFLIVAGGDETGRPWVTILEGPDGFVSSPDTRTLTVATSLTCQDPLALSLTSGATIGVIGIDLATRRRNRLNGVIHRQGGGFAIQVRQSFGNCPQYIREREWHQVEPAKAPVAHVSDRLNADQRARIAAADTFFIGSGYRTGGARPSDGYDASHRGGEPGFVRIADDGTLQIPDYAGNNFFNTLGNLIRDARVGLLFVDFDTGGMLQISGVARIDWTPQNSHDPNARRMINVTVEKVIDRSAALSLRWCEGGTEHLQLRLVDKVVESDQITSFHLSDADGRALKPFEAGQNLPIELHIPGQRGRARRSYSLSGSPFAKIYRISVKREEHGIMSRFLHDHVEIGDLIEARAPSGNFIKPRKCPLVLTSAGVGVTPMLAMLHAAVAENTGRPVWFVHGTRDSGTHAFRAEVDALISMGKNFHRKIFYSAPTEKDVAARAYDATHRITAADLLALNAGSDAHYMLCGPSLFLADVRSGLERGNVISNNIHVEMFGSQI